MVATVYVHIGSDKAGSSTLQHFLYVNRAKLPGLGVRLLEPGLRPRAGHPKIFQDFKRREWETIRSDLEAEAQEMRAFILSWEGVHFFDLRRLRWLRAELRPWRVKLVFYAREQASLVQSGLLQQIKQGARDAVSPLDLYPTSPELTPPTRDLEAMIERVESVFGRGALILRVLEADRLWRGDIRWDFLRTIGAEPDAIDAAGLEPVEDINPSLTVEAALAALMTDRIARSDDDRVVLRDVFLRLSQVVPGSKYFLPRRSVERIRAHYADGNRRVARRHFDRDDLFKMGRAHHDARYDPQALAETLRRFATIWPEYPSAEPELKTGPLALLYRNATPLPGWRIEHGVARLTEPAAVLKFRLEYRRRLPQHAHMGLQLEPPRGAQFTARFGLIDLETDAVEDLGTVAFPGGKLVAPLDKLDPLHRVALRIEPATPADEVRLTGVLIGYTLPTPHLMRRPPKGGR